MITVSPEMIEILKNFTQITNAGIVFPQGKTLSVQDGGGIGVDRSSGRTIIAVAQLDQEIDTGFAVYDPLQLYSAISMFEEPTIAVDPDTDKIIVANKGKAAGKFVISAASSEVVKQPGRVAFPEDSDNINFRLTSEMYQRIFKGVSIVSSPEIMMYGQEGELYIAAYDQTNKNSDTFIVPIGETPETFDVVIKVDSINKMMKNVDYDITISPKGMMRAVSTNSKIDVCYYIAGQFQHK